MNYETLLPAIVGLLLAAVLILNVRLWLRSRNPGAPGGSRTNGPGGDVASAASERHRAAEIIDRMAEGVLVLDHSLRPVLANPSARAILGLHRVTLPHRLPSEEILMVARRALDEGEGGEHTSSRARPRAFRRWQKRRARPLPRAITMPRCGSQPAFVPKPNASAAWSENCSICPAWRIPHGPPTRRSTSGEWCAGR